MRKYHRDLKQTVIGEGLNFSHFEFGKHLKIVCEEGTIVAASSPSDCKNMRNIGARARRMSRLR